MTFHCFNVLARRNGTKQVKYLLQIVSDICGDQRRGGCVQALPVGAVSLRQGRYVQGVDANKGNP